MSYKSNNRALCITAMYMAMGAELVVRTMPQCNYEILSESRGGHIGVFADLSDLAMASEEILEALGFEDFPGVYDYEVSEPFGQWFAENDPDFDVARAELETRIKTWFEVRA